LLGSNNLGLRKLLVLGKPPKNRLPQMSRHRRFRDNRFGRCAKIAKEQRGSPSGKPQGVLRCAAILYDFSYKVYAKSGVLRPFVRFFIQKSEFEPFNITFCVIFRYYLGTPSKVEVVLAYANEGLKDPQALFTQSGEDSLSPCKLPRTFLGTHRS